MSCKLKWPPFAAVLAAVLALAASAYSLSPPRDASAQASVGRIVDNIDGVGHDGAQLYIAGWACQQG
jgi:hypothetical protein